MSEATPDPAQAMLAELAEMDLALARKADAVALAAEEPHVVAELSRAYQRLARSLRQTLALKAKLSLDQDRHARARQSVDLREAVRFYGLSPGQLPPFVFAGGRAPPTRARPTGAALQARLSALCTG